MRLAGEEVEMALMLELADSWEADAQLLEEARSLQQQVPQSDARNLKPEARKRNPESRKPETRSP